MLFLGYYLRGVFVTLSLIIAIGAQNAYVLKQGLLKNHIFLIVNICIVADILVFGIGALSIAWIEDFFPRVSIFIYILGALFLFGYGMVSFLAIRKEAGLEVNVDTPSLLDTTGGDSANTPVLTLNRGVSLADKRVSTRKAQTILTLLVVTFLNPHFYIDTFFIIGAQVSFLKGAEKLFFFLGCCSASLMWFYTLGYGSRLLSPLFARPMTWKFLNFFIGVLMWVIGYFFTLEFLAEWERLRK